MPLSHPIARLFMRGQSIDEVHPKYCAVRNRGTALLFFVVCIQEVVLTWKLLGKELPAYSFSGVVQDFIVIVGCIALALTFRCFRERFQIGLFVLMGLIALLSRTVPNLIDPFVGAIRYSIFGLWVLALFMSLSMLVQAFRTPHIDIKRSSIKANKRAVVFLVLIAAMLFLGALLYFFPSR